jgi:hypothetical protein
LLGRIHADGYRTNTGFSELIQVLLDTS